ncbi:MAG: hypothetical protein PHQ59_04300 [Candidatus Daviesbacteria bacterium]|nr:hypothetical protein [Candidatus Daviesbacteria bacterium]
MPELIISKEARNFDTKAAVKVAAAANVFIDELEFDDLLDRTYMSCYLEAQEGSKTILWGILPRNFNPDRSLIKKIRKATWTYRDAVDQAGLPLKGHVTLLQPEQLPRLMDHLKRNNIYYVELI